MSLESVRVRVRVRVKGLGGCAEQYQAFRDHHQLGTRGVLVLLDANSAGAPLERGCGGTHSDGGPHTQLLRSGLQLRPGPGPGWSAAGSSASRGLLEVLPLVKHKCRSEAKPLTIASHAPLIILFMYLNLPLGASSPCKALYRNRSSTKNGPDLT